MTNEVRIRVNQLYSEIIHSYQVLKQQKEVKEDEFRML